LLCLDGCLLRPDSYWECLRSSAMFFIVSGWLLGMFTHFRDVVDCARVVVYRLRVALTWCIDLRDAFCHFCANRISEGPETD
jgi:hypothetical protein